MELHNMSKKKTQNGGRMNKSQAIRDSLANDPNASPKELSAKLSAAGIKVSPTFVSMIKFKMKAKRKAGKKNRSNQAEGLVTANDLLEAKKLADRVGGIEKAESLLGTLKKLL
jgi:hypothetical protein